MAESTKANAKEELFEWVEMMTTAMTVFTVLFLFLCGMVQVNGPSMQPGLQDGDRLLTAPAYYSLKTGDIAVVHREQGNSIIKRVIATGGQTVNIDFETGAVLVDGKELDEPYTAEPDMLMRDDFISFPAKVPAGYLFLMGDNRNDSKDSRYQDVGMIREGQVFGKVLFRIFPFGELGTVN